jgi:hypothetical protein
VWVNSIFGSAVCAVLPAAAVAPAAEALVPASDVVAGVVSLDVSGVVSLVAAELVSLPAAGDVSLVAASAPIAAPAIAPAGGRSLSVAPAGTSSTSHVRHQRHRIAASWISSAQ